MLYIYIMEGAIGVVVFWDFAELLHIIAHCQYFYINYEVVSLEGCYFVFSEEYLFVLFIIEQDGLSCSPVTFL